MKDAERVRISHAAHENAKTHTIRPERIFGSSCITDEECGAQAGHYQHPQVAAQAIMIILRPTVWSHIFFLLPLSAAAVFGSYFALLLIVLVVISSVSYHLLSERVAGSLWAIDDFLAQVLALVDAALVFFGGFTFPYAYLAFLSAFAAAFCYSKKPDTDAGYQRFHSLWHIAAAFVTAFSILAFYA